MGTYNIYLVKLVLNHIYKDKYMYQLLHARLLLHFTFIVSTLRVAATGEIGRPIPQTMRKSRR